MLLGRIVGEVWATRRDPLIEDMKLLLVSPIDENREIAASFIVAVDVVGAGVGELVLVAQGSSARQSELTKSKPVDAVIMAIIDDFSVAERDWAAFDARSFEPGAGA